MRGPAYQALGPNGNPLGGPTRTLYTKNALSHVLFSRWSSHHSLGNIFRQRNIFPISTLVWISPSIHSHFYWSSYNCYLLLSTTVKFKLLLCLLRCICILKLYSPHNISIFNQSDCLFDEWLVCQKFCN